MCDHAATTTSHTETTVYFAAGHWDLTTSAEFQPHPAGPTADMALSTFRALFDEAGEDTVDTTGDISGKLLLEIVGAGPAGLEADTARVRLVARWARNRGLRVRFHTIDVEHQDDEDQDHEG